MTILSVLPNPRALRALVRLLTDLLSVWSLLLFTVTNFTFANMQQSTGAAESATVNSCVYLCECMSGNLSPCVYVPLYSSSLCCTRRWGGLASQRFSDVVRGFYLIFGPRKKERVTSWWMVNLNFQFIQKEKRGGGYEPSDETNLFPLGRAWFKLNITFSVKLVWRSLSFFFFGAWFNSLMGCSFREEPFRPPLCLSLFPAAAHSSLSLVLVF